MVYSIANEIGAAVSLRYVIVIYAHIVPAVFVVCACPHAKKDEFERDHVQSCKKAFLAI